MAKQALSRRQRMWQGLQQALARGSYIFSELFPVTAAAYITKQWPDDPLWILTVAPPGSGKTTTLHLFESADKVKAISDLTPASLITAWGGHERDPSVLAHIDQHLMIVTDFSSIMALGWDRERQVLAILRQAFDGRVAKDFAMIRREYQLHFNAICAATEAVDQHALVAQQLGERFLRYRPPSVSLPWPPPRVDARLPKIVAEWAGWVAEHSQPEVDPPDLLLDLAGLVALMRTEVAHDYRTHDVAEIPQPERPARLSKQLCKLYGGIHSATGDSGFAKQIAVRVALSSLPPARVAVYRTLIREPGLSTSEIAERTGLGYTVMRYVTTDMQALGLLEHCRHSTTKLYSWRIPKDLETLYQSLFHSKG